MKLSQTMLTFLERVRDGQGSFDRVITDDPHRTVVAALDRGYITTYQDGVTEFRTKHSIGAFGRDPYEKMRKVPIIRAKITPKGLSAIERHNAPSAENAEERFMDVIGEVTAMLGPK